MVAAARRLFEERGYSATGTEEIVRAAQVTRGALYHHYADKRDLLRVVVLEIQEEILERVILAAAAAPTTWDAFVAGWLAFLDISDDPEVRVLMIDAPPVLGIAEWTEIDDTYCLQPALAMLKELVHEGTVPDQPVGTLGRVLLTASNGLATHIAGSEDPAATRAAFVPVWTRMIESVRSGTPVEAVAGPRLAIDEPGGAT